MKTIHYGDLSVLITAEIQVGKQTFENTPTQMFQTNYKGPVEDTNLL